MQENIRKVERDVMIIDDEPHLAEIIAETLKKRGNYRSTIYSNEGYAIDGSRAIVEGRNGPYFSLILCDIKMAGISGPDIAEEILELYRRNNQEEPEVIFISGSYDKKDAKRVAEVSDYPILKKPCSAEYLMSWVNLASNLFTNRYKKAG